MQELVSSSGVRGLAMKEISPELCFNLGVALSGTARGVYAVGHDVRLTSPLLAKSFANGLNAGGSDALFLGLAPTPAVAFYSKGKLGGAMTTASHNPPEYNGVKLFDCRGASVTQEFYCTLLSRAESKPAMAEWLSLGSIRTGEGLHRYIEATASLPLRKKWKVAIDPGNGATSITAPMAMALAGCAAHHINLAPDGRFPGRGSEPHEKALAQLSGLVAAKGLDAGFAFDGDGDRVAIVDERGSPIPQDVALAFVASRAIKNRGGGCAVVNVDTSAIVDIMVESAGGKVCRCKVGDVYILEDLLKLSGVFGGEACGAWIFPERSLCPDGVLSALVFLALLEEESLKPSQIGEGLPRLYLTRRKVPCPISLKRSIMESFKSRAPSTFKGSEITDIDGIRLAMADKSWVLVRPSGTEPAMRITAESSSAGASEKLAEDSMQLIKEIMGERPRKQ
jgi:phosphomannomutase